MKKIRSDHDLEGSKRKGNNKKDENMDGNVKRKRDDQTEVSGGRSRNHSLEGERRMVES